MENKLKTVSKFSTDALSIAIKSMPKDARDGFEHGLNLLSNSLGEKQTMVGEKKKLSDDAIFKNSIVPQIKRRVDEIEMLEMNKQLKIDVNFNLQTNFDSMTESEILQVHGSIVLLEQRLASLTILAQYSRGKLYITLADRLRREGQNLKTYVEKNLKVSYTTVLRYMCLTTVLSAYPRLTLSELSFSQIIKHKTRLMKYLSGDEGLELAAKLSMRVEIYVQGKKVEINHIGMTPPKMKLSIDPDWHDIDAATEIDIPEERLDKWVGAFRNVEDEEGDLTSFMLNCMVKDDD